MNFTRVSLLLVALFTAFTIELSAQPGGGGGGMGGGGGRSGGRGPGMMMQGGDIDLVASCGVFEIEAKDIIKKNKVKDPELVSGVEQLVSNYIIAYGDVCAEYREQIEMLEEKSEELTELQSSGDMSNMRTVMQPIMEAARPIREKMTAIHKSLDEGMKALFANDEKALSRWTIYYAGVCEDNGFSTRERQQRGNGENGERPQRGEGGGMGGGMNGGMGGGMM